MGRRHSDSVTDGDEPFLSLSDAGEAARTELALIPEETLDPNACRPVKKYIATPPPETLDNPAAGATASGQDSSVDRRMGRRNMGTTEVADSRLAMNLGASQHCSASRH